VGPTAGLQAAGKREFLNLQEPKLREARGQSLSRLVRVLVECYRISVGIARLSVGIPRLNVKKLVRQCLLGPDTLQSLDSKAIPFHAGFLLRQFFDMKMGAMFLCNVD
jgi:hypothetical protein